MTEQAVLGGGCFWCLDAAFRALEGVSDVESGYAGGGVPEPTYEQVCAGTSGHAEVVRVNYDPQIINFAGVLDVFWLIHDPTTLNRQGADLGTQYRSVIFYLNEQQAAVARKSMQDIAEQFDQALVTEVAPLETFWPAERHHQDYYRMNHAQPYCQMVISPKLSKLRSLTRERLKT